MSFDVKIRALVSRLRGSVGAQGDGLIIPQTVDSFGRAQVSILSASDHAACDEGSMFTCLAQGAIPLGPATVAPVSTTPFITIYNASQPGLASSPNLWLRRMYVQMVSTQTSETGLYMSGWLDNTPAYTSGGALSNPKNINPKGPSSIATIYMGTLVGQTLTAAAIQVGIGAIRTTIPVLGDEYIIRFGGPDYGESFLSSSAGASRQVIDFPAIIIPPGWSYRLAVAFGATSTGTPNFLVETNYIER